MNVSIDIGTKTFVVPDMHGHYESLRALLRAAGVIDENDERYDEVEARELEAEARMDGSEPDAEFWSRTENQRSYRVVSLGDLANATLNDVNGDEQCLLKVRDWFDYIILGNHESGYLFRDMGFNGYHEAPHLKSLYNSLYRQGIVVPAVMIGNTLLSHAGVHEYFDFQDSDEAFDAIWEVWENYNEYETSWNEDGTSEHRFSFRNGQIEIPKSMLLNAVGKARGGDLPFGGILWSDWREERKNINFNQIVGHTPISDGPVLTTYESKGVFTLNLDVDAKSGKTPFGIWIDEEGDLLEFVSPARTSSVA